MRLSEAKIEHLKLKSGRLRVSDGNGLTLELLRRGHRVWRYRYRFHGREEVTTLGIWPAVSLAQARQQRDQLAEAIAAGDNPATARRRIAGLRVTIRDFGAQYVRDVVEKTRKNTLPIRRMLEREIYPSLGSKPVSAVTILDAQRLIFAKRDAGKPAAAAAIRNLLKRLFDYARVCGFTTENPAAATPLKFVIQARARSRTLSAGEVAHFLKRLDRARISKQLRLALRLILLTLCRKSELRLARWQDVDLDRSVWEMPSSLTKNGDPHVVYLSRQAVELFVELRRISGNTMMVLPGKGSISQPLAANVLNRAIARIRWDLPHFTVHDLRRTGSTILHEQGHAPDVIEKALNHSIGGIRGVYNKAKYAEQRKAMLQAWADFLDGLIDSKHDSSSILSCSG